jgi:hypothetical protein
MPAQVPQRGRVVRLAPVVVSLGPPGGMVERDDGQRWSVVLALPPAERRAIRTRAHGTYRIGSGPIPIAITTWPRIRM